MQRRQAKRINVKIEAMFHCGNKVCNGVVTNISEKGMFIDTKLVFPVDMNFDLIIPFRDSRLRFPVKITRLQKAQGKYVGLGLEIAGSHEHYIDYVSKLRELQGK